MSSSSSSHTTPWVIVDDFDSGITYNGPWIWSLVLTSDVSQEVAYNNTGHSLLANATSEQAGSFSYTFEGTDVAVYGNSTIFNISTPVSSDASTQALPVWECLVDGAAISMQDPYGHFPWLSYCAASGLADGVHTLDVKVSESGSYGFNLDFVRYLPSTAAVTGGRIQSRGATAYLDAMDAALVYGVGWAPLASGMMTFATSSATVEDPAVFMNFVGSSLTWHGLSKDIVFTQNLPSLAISFDGLVSGSYNIDGGDSIPFNLNLSSDSQTLLNKLNPYNTVLFRTNNLELGPHNISVYYDGSNAMWPLTLDYLTIENGFTTSTATASSAAAGPAGKSKGAVIGGAVGGIFGGILLILLGLFLVRQRKMAQRKKRSSNVRHWANADIKLRPVGREVGAEEIGAKAQLQQKYPCSFEGKNQAQL